MVDIDVSGFVGHCEVVGGWGWRDWIQSLDLLILVLLMVNRSGDMIENDVRQW